MWGFAQKKPGLLVQVQTQSKPLLFEAHNLVKIHPLFLTCSFFWRKSQKKRLLPMRTYLHTDFGTLPCTAFMAWSLIALLGFFIQALPAWKFSEKKKTNWLECFFQGVTASTSVFSRCALSLHMSSFQAARSTTSCFDSGLFFLSCRVLNVKLGV